MQRAPALLLTAVLLAVLAKSTAHAQLFSPGELSRAHAELDGDTACGRCHNSGRGIDEAACSQCHDDIGKQRARGQGQHGTTFKPKDCGQCHVEHRGRSHQLIRWPGGKQDSFSHGNTGFALVGKHARVKCGKCHDDRNRRGASTFLGASAQCVSCHKADDVHEARFGARCQDCHDARSWAAKLSPKDHDRTRFSLKGKHQQVECAKCHGEPPRHRGLQFQRCGDCHDDPHAGKLGARCERCHQERAWDAIEMARGAHPGLRIGGGHGKVACKTCHDAGLAKAPSRGDRCVDCHRPVHEARFGRRCQRCHGRIRWLGLPEKVGRESHELTRFALVGMHEKVECAHCHKHDLPRAKRYRGLPTERCSDCHEDAHGGKLSRFAQTDCAGCHDAHGFAPTRFTVEQHADAAFALIGRHVAVPCNGCHQVKAPRLDWSVGKSRCADCHDNPHGEQFASEMAAGGCESCHSPLAWNAPNIDHSGWPLTGAHAQAACGRCHEPSEADRRAGGGASYRGVPRDCEGCHADTHAGQFRLSAPERPCAHCHGTDQFQLPGFDHARVTGFALRAKHAAVKCEACHPTATLRNGDTARRYRLGYQRCRDCHADPHAEATR